MVAFEPPVTKEISNPIQMLGAAVVWYGGSVFAFTEGTWALSGGRAWEAVAYLSLCLVCLFLAPKGCSRIVYDPQCLRIKNLFRPELSLSWLEIELMTYEIALDCEVLLTRAGRKIRVYLTTKGHTEFIHSPPTTPIWLRQLRFGTRASDRARAAGLLGQAGCQVVEEGLLDVVNLASESVEVRRAAAMALGQIWFEQNGGQGLHEVKLERVQMEYREVVRDSFESSMRDFEESE